MCAFAPFVAGAFVHDFNQSAAIAWISTVIFLLISFVFLLRSLAFHQDAQKTFLFFFVISLILSILLSCFSLMLEGYTSFESIQAFETTLYHSSDMIAMGPTTLQFQDVVEKGSLLEALQFAWAPNCTYNYNNILSIYKFGFAAYSMPGLGYYSFAILAWWFDVIFYVLALHVYSLSGDGQQKNYFLAGMLAWFILPFALPYDREAIVVVPLGIMVLGLIRPYRLSALDWISIACCMLLISIHRNVYIALIPFLTIIFILYRFKIDFLVKISQTLSRRGALFLLVILLFLSAFFVHLTNVFSFLINFSEDVTAQLLIMGGQEQDLWQQFRLGIPVVDDFLKLLFIILTPFPYYQMFKNGDEFSLIVPPVLISLNVFPVFMVGKLFVVVSAVRKILDGVTYYPVLFLISLIFVLPVLASPRVGPAYLIPSLSILVLWLLRNGLDAQFVKRSFVTYLSIVCLAHFLYFLVYQKL